MREVRAPIDFLAAAGVGQSKSIRRLWSLLLLALFSILATIAAFAPRRIWTASEVVLFTLAVLLCSLVALWLGMTEYREWLARIQQGLRLMAARARAILEGQTQDDADEPQGHLELGSLIARTLANQQDQERRLAELAGTLEVISAHVAALEETLPSHRQTTSEVIVTLTEMREKWTTRLRELQSAIETIAAKITDIAQEQTDVRSTLQEQERTLAQAVQKMEDHMAQAAASGAAEVPPLPASLLPAEGPGPLDAAPPASVTARQHSSHLHAAQAVPHGDQIRYEVGPDRDNPGFWANANDWAEWTLDVARPGRFKVTAEIAAVGGGRFQVVLADQTLTGTAPNTGDYGRFQQVELGVVELTVTGKTQVAVRPIPDGWQPMNLRSLDLMTLPA